MQCTIANVLSKSIQWALNINIMYVVIVQNAISAGMIRFLQWKGSMLVADCFNENVANYVYFLFFSGYCHTDWRWNSSEDCRYQGRCNWYCKCCYRREMSVLQVCLLTLPTRFVNRVKCVKNHFYFFFHLCLCLFLNVQFWCLTALV